MAGKNDNLKEDMHKLRRSPETAAREPPWTDMVETMQRHAGIQEKSATYLLRRRYHLAEQETLEEA